MHVLSIQRRDLARSASKSFVRLLSFEPTLYLLWCGDTVGAAAASASAVFVDCLGCAKKSDGNCRRNLVGVAGILPLMMTMMGETLKSEN